MLAGIADRATGTTATKHHNAGGVYAVLVALPAAVLLRCWRHSGHDV